MGSGYHSKSPEEFRQFLESYNPKQKKRSWMQYIIFANIMGILFVMFVLMQDKSLGVNFKASNKIKINELEAYFTKSSEFSPESVSYFLFVQNQSGIEKNFPTPEMNILFTLTSEEREECLQKKIELNPKKIGIKNTEFFSFIVLESEISKTQGCNTFFHKIIKKGLFDLFAKGNRKFTPEINIIQNNQIYRMSIPN